MKLFSPERLVEAEIWENGKILNRRARRCLGSRSAGRIDRG